MAHPPTGISAAQVRAVARLARLALTDAQAGQYREQLSAVLGYVEQMRKLDLTGVEPLGRPVETPGRLDDDTPGPVLANAVLMGMSPANMEPFVKVPRVLGEAGGA